MPQEPALTDLGDGLFAWIQPDGGWGLSNAGLVHDSGEHLLVDTLFDLPRTRAMLAAMARAVPGADSPGQVVNTHANGDHCWGNQLVGEAEIIASARGAAEMVELPPATMQKLAGAARLGARLGPLGPVLGRLLQAMGARTLGGVLEAGAFVEACFGDFDFDGIELTPPTRTFTEALSLEVGSRTVELLEVGPAHTRGDVLVHVPDAGVVFTGDILFHGGHPIVWEGPVQNWLDACAQIEAWAPQTVVAGHGPLADLSAVRQLREYLLWLDTEARARHAAGQSATEAAHEMARGAFTTRSERERVVVNVATVYRELDGGEAPDAVESFVAMARLWRALAED